MSSLTLFRRQNHENQMGLKNWRRISGKKLKDLKFSQIQIHYLIYITVKIPFKMIEVITKYFTLNLRNQMKIKISL